MKAVPARLIQQVQQRGFEVLHLLFRLGAGLGCIRGEQGTEPGDLIRKPVVLSRKDRNLLLGNSGSGLGLIPLMLPKVRSVTPETDGSSFRFVTHASSYTALPRVPFQHCHNGRPGQAIASTSRVTCWRSMAEARNLPQA